jgi:hypothetical protein
MPHTLGPYKVAKALRDKNYDVTVLHHLHIFSVKEIKEILTQLINEDTLFVGVNNSFYKSIDSLELKDFKIILEEHRPAEMGSLLPHGHRYNQELKKVIKNANPNCKLVLGGPEASDKENNKIFDYIVLGYADISIVNLADHLSNSGIKLEKQYKSIYGPVIINDSKAETYKFAETLMSYEEKDAILPGETMVTEIARGCIFKCAFCAYPLNGKKKLDFIKHKDLLVKEFKDNYEKYGTFRYLFSDDTVNDSVEKCRMIYEISQELPFKIEWWGYIRLDLMAAHPETIDLLFGSGLKATFFGIETFNQKTGSAIGKGGSRQKLIETLKHIKSTYGDSVTLNAGLIYGLPFESKESLKTTSEFLLSDDNPLDTWTVQALRIRERPEQSNGFISDLDTNWSKYGYKKTNEGKDYAISGNLLNWQNEHTSYNEVLKMLDKLDSLSKKQNKTKVSGNYALLSMGMGMKESEIFNKKMNDVDWNQLDQLKIKRAELYRKKFTTSTNIKNLNSLTAKFTTFTEYINSNDFKES